MRANSPMIQNKNRRPTILIIDSGVGGLSITNEIRQLRPHDQILYLADNEAFPYGTKDDKWVLERVSMLVHKITRTHQIDLIVVACNTASTIVLERLRNEFEQPFVGVVPAIKPAAALTQTKSMAVLATDATVKRQYTAQLIQSFASSIEVLLVPCPMLVVLAEQKLRGEKGFQNELCNHALTLLPSHSNNKPIDTVVLACTHFPLLKNELKSVLPHIPIWVDSGKAIANRVQSLLEHTDDSFVGGDRPLNRFISTSLNANCQYKETQIQGYLGNFEFGFLEV